MALIINQEIKNASVPLQRVYVRLTSVNHPNGTIEVGKAFYATKQDYKDNKNPINSIVPALLTESVYFKEEVHFKKDNNRGLKEIHDLIKKDFCDRDETLKAKNIVIEI